MLGLNPLIEKSVEIASQWHDGTYRKGAWREDPYPSDSAAPAAVPVISHLVAIGLILQRLGWDDETVAAGILHDTLEDRDRHGRQGSRERLEKLVGREVAGLVVGVTETKKDARGSFRKWHDRKRDYLRVLSEGEERHLAISLADKIHNLWTMNQSLEAGINIFQSTDHRRALTAGPNDQVWFFESILDIASPSRDPRIVRMRDGLKVELERFKQLTMG